MANETTQPSSRERVAARRRTKAASPKQAARPARPPRRATPKATARQVAPRRAPRVATTPGPRQQAISWVASGRIASAVLLLGALVGMIYAFTNARFTVQAVEVRGAEVLNAAEVVELADAQGQSIWYIDSNAVVEKLKTSAYIEQASASIALPGTLYLNIIERRPELRWSSAGQHFLVDSTGRVLGTAEASASITNTLVIEDQSARALKPNDYVDREALATARAVSLRLPAETGMQPISINWSDERGVFVLAPDNKTVLFGSSERLDEKLTVLDTLLKQGTAFTFLDLRPKTPFYRNK